MYEPKKSSDYSGELVNIRLYQRGGISRRGFLESHSEVCRGRPDDRRPFSSEEVRHRFPTGVPPLDAEIGEILTGKTAGRRNHQERILILNLGIAACDISVAAEVYRRC